MTALPDELEPPGRSRHREPEATFDFGYADDVPVDPDPLDPHPEHPTPIDLVQRLTRPQREKRVERLVEMAHTRFREALDVHGAGKNIVAICALRSGGNDSEAVAHLFRDVATHHVHADTGTGIEATRQFVRDTARDHYRVPLLEFKPPEGQGYAELVLGLVMARSRDTGELVRAWPGGFPGQAAHDVMQQRLKGRGLEQLPHHFGISGSKVDRVVQIAGRRRSESKRRASVPHHQADGTVVWASPIAVWHKMDLRAYRLMNPGICRNPVAHALGLSGECGCLANAIPGEVKRWKDAYPDEPFIRWVIETERFLAVERDCTRKGCKWAHLHYGVLTSDGKKLAVPDHRRMWGWGAYFDEKTVVPPMGIDSLCGPSCGADPLLDLMDPLYELEAT